MCPVRKIQNPPHPGGDRPHVFCKNCRYGVRKGGMLERSEVFDQFPRVNIDRTTGGAQSVGRAGLLSLIREDLLQLRQPGRVFSGRSQMRHLAPDNDSLSGSQAQVA